MSVAMATSDRLFIIYECSVAWDGVLLLLNVIIFRISPSSFQLVHFCTAELRVHVLLCTVQVKPNVHVSDT